MKDAQELADLIHEKMCRLNHTDGCGYHYRKWTDIPLGYPRADYLKKAQAILKLSSYKTAVKIVNQL